MKLRPKLIACDGEVRSQYGWSRHLGGSRTLVKNRIDSGWPACRAATLPVHAAISAAVKRSWRRRALRRLVLVGGVFRLRSERRVE